jgi:eukaryotic-like serine/threonine-protein kinase
MALAAGARLGPYEILSALGAGGMGEVYRATDSNLKRSVAIKVLPAAVAGDADRLARFQREAEVLAALNHPNIAAIYGLEKTTDFTALVMELVEGEDLSKRLARGAIPLDDALPIAKQIADALEAAHDQGIIHCDLKPANIKVRSDGTVKILDFGLAKVVDRAPPPVSGLSEAPTISMPAVTLTGVIVGTPAYMSPEQATGKHVDRRADIWAYGSVFYELLTGHAAYSGRTVAEILASVRADAPDLKALPAQTPQSIRILIGRCLDHNPRSRLRDVGEARIAIERALAGDSVDLKNPPPTAPTATRLAWFLVMVLGLVAGRLAVTHFAERRPESPTLRFQVVPPEKTTLDDVAISPDGLTLAFTASDLSRTAHLWLRPLDSAAAQLVPGTDDASYPFWSPDSRQIAFFAEGKLKKTTISRDPPQTLCEAAYGRGGAWSPSGVIVFGPSTSSGLWRVSADGGKAEPLTELDVARDETAHYWPTFLPNGRHFLLTIRSARRENSGIYVGSTDAKVRTRLLGDLSNGSVVTSADGTTYLVFARGETLMAQPFDLGTLHLSSKPQLVADHVGNSVNLSLASFSVSQNGVLAYTPNSALPETLPTWFDRKGNRLGVVGEPGLYARLQLPPNETAVVLDRMDPRTSEWDIWLIDSKRAVTSRLTLDPRDELFPVLSPDGKRVAFASNRAGVFDLYEQEIGGASGETLLLKSGVSKYPTDWSPDGRFLLYRQEDPLTRSDVWVLPLPTTAQNVHHDPIPLLVSPANESEAVFSPDGKWVAYVSDESGKREVYVRAFSDPNTSVSRKWQVSAGGGSKPRWPRLGREIFYASATRKMMAVDLRMSAVLETQAPTPLFALPETPDYVSYGVTNDGQQFLAPAPTYDLTSLPATVVVNWIVGLKK